MDNQKVLIGLAVVAILAVVYCNWCNKSTKNEKKKEKFTSAQNLLNAKTYTYIPVQDCPDCPTSRPDFAGMTCNSVNTPADIRRMEKQKLKDEIELHYNNPKEMLDTADLLPESDLSGLSFGVDPADDFANKYVWHRTTHARLKRRNWETGAAMIRGDLIIDPGNQSWFQHDNDYRDLTPGFIPKQYCGEVDVEDLTYNMHKVY